MHAPVKGGRSSDGGILVGCSHSREFRIQKMLFQDKVESLMTRGLVVQMTCMLIIASAMFFKQHKNKNGALMIPVGFFLAGMNGLLYLGAFCCRDYVMNPS